MSEQIQILTMLSSKVDLIADDVKTLMAEKNFREGEKSAYGKSIKVTSAIVGGGVSALGVIGIELLKWWAKI